MSITVEMQLEDLGMLHRLTHQEALRWVGDGSPQEAAAALHLWLLLDQALDRYEREEEDKN